MKTGRQRMKSEKEQVEDFLNQPSEHQDLKRLWKPYLDATLGFRNHWYPALFSREILGNDPHPITLLGEKILVRRIDGKVYAIEDRCLHRRVALSAKLECYTKDTVTCWYHGFTYDFTNGGLVAVLTEPGCSLIGKAAVKTYPVQEANGLIFIFVGDQDAVDLSEDVPPGFLDESVALNGIRRDVKSNWRLGCENGFDTTHIYIHRNSKFIKETTAMLPLGLVPTDKHSMDIVDGPGPKGVIDKLASNYMPIFQSSVGDEQVSAMMKENPTIVASTVSAWLPCALRVEDFPWPGITQFEYYVPIDETNHVYWQVLGTKTESEQEANEFKDKVDTYWTDVALRGFNDDDVWAREALEEAYADGRGWATERLFRPDMCIVEWRKLASKHNRGIQG